MFDAALQPDLFESEEPVPDAFEVLAELIAEGVGVGGATCDDPHVLRLAMATWATVHGGLVLWLQGGAAHMSGLDDEAFHALILDAAIRSLRGDPAWRG